MVSRMEAGKIEQTLVRLSLTAYWLLSFLDRVPYRSIRRDGSEIFMIS